MFLMFNDLQSDTELPAGSTEAIEILFSRSDTEGPIRVCSTSGGNTIKSCGNNGWCQGYSAKHRGTPIAQPEKHHYPLSITSAVAETPDSNLPHSETLQYFLPFIMWKTTSIGVVLYFTFLIFLVTAEKYLDSELKQIFPLESINCSAIAFRDWLLCFFPLRRLAEMENRNGSYLNDSISPNESMWEPLFVCLLFVSHSLN